MKPKAAPLPKRKGIYWIKIATQTYDNKCEGNGWNWNLPPTYCWIIAEVDPNKEPYPISQMLGNDRIATWDDDDDGVVVEVGAEIIRPDSKL